MKTLNKSLKKQQGIALFVGLIMLLILTLVAVTAMKMTMMELRMAKSDNLRLNALVTSEGPRKVAGDLLDNHVYHRGWPKSGEGSDYDTLSDIIPTELSLIKNSGTGFCTASSSNCIPKILYNEKGVDEDILDSCSLDIDMKYEFSSSEGGGTADIMVVLGLVTISPGNSAAMVSGYEGVGKALATSGAQMLFIVRSVAQFGQAKATTDTDYRIIVRN